MTSATSTAGGGGGAATRTLPLLQPSKLDNAAPMNPAKIFFFIVRFLAIQLLARRATTLAKLCANAAKGHFVTLLQCYRLCIICNDSKICRKQSLTEMQHGGEPFSTLPATASLNLAMRKARSKISPNRQPYRDR